MNRIFYYNSIIILIIVFFYNCDEGNSKGKEVSIPDDIPETLISPQIDVKEIIQSLPSPVEMAALIKSSEIPFSNNYLAVPQDIDDFETNFKKAIGLGVLSADLGYLNVYEKNNDIVNVLGSIRKVADDLNVVQFFDFNTLKEIAVSGNDLDTLIFLSQTSFRQMDDHLRKMNRSNLSALVVTGVWIEGLYLVTQIVKKDKENIDLKETIGQQKFSLEMLNKVIQNYKGLDRNFTKLAIDFADLKKIYDKVIIEDIEGEIDTIYIDNEPVITTSDESILKMTDEQLASIISVTENLRNKLISY